ncbi:homeobox protein Meis2-like [Syngnathus typhle]
MNVEWKTEGGGIRKQCSLKQPHSDNICSGLPGVPADYVPQSGPMGVSMAPAPYSNPRQMNSYPGQLRHVPPPLHSYPHHHHHHAAMLMHGASSPSSHPGMSAQRPPLLTPMDPATAGAGLDIHA